MGGYVNIIVYQSSFFEAKSGAEYVIPFLIVLHLYWSRHAQFLLVVHHGYWVPCRSMLNSAGSRSRYCQTPDRLLLVTCKSKKHFNILASSLHDMYNSTDTYTGSDVDRVTKDRSARLHPPSTVKSQLGSIQHQMTITQQNVRTLLDKETTDRPERRTSLVAMELAKYNINIVVLSETCFHASGSLK